MSKKKSFFSLSFLQKKPLPLLLVFLSIVLWPVYTEASPKFSELYDGISGQSRLADQKNFHFPKGLAERLKNGSVSPAEALKEVTALGNSTPKGSLAFAVNGSTRIEKGAVDAQLRSEPVTIVIFPGILGEFIYEKAFGEALQGQSKFKTLWKARARGLVDKSFDLHSARNINKPLTELVSAGSIDSDGKTRVRVIHLNTPRFTLESANGLNALGPMFVRRLDKIFSALGGPPKNLVFVGYSMGTTVALDVLSRAEAQNKPWLKNVRALTSVGGVVWGSSAANAAMDPKGTGPTAMQIKLLMKLSDSLAVPTGNYMKKLKTRLRNYRYWAKFAKDIAPYLDTKPTGAKIDAGGLGTVLRHALTGALKSFALDPIGGIVQHGKNVLRWKILIRRLLAGVNNLTTQSRLEWFRKHTIPAHIRYYTVAGVVLDPKEYPKLAKNDTVQTNSMDYETNLKGARDYISLGGSKLNDGQVSLGETQVWPELVRALNPKQKPFRQELLAVIPTHHWGLALKTGVNGTNPFSSLNLLKSIAAKASYDISADKAEKVRSEGLLRRLDGMGR